jgi:hypothetical protein
VDRNKLIELLEGYYPDASFLADKILALHSVSNYISGEDIKRYRKEGRLSGATKREPFYKLIAKNFDENYEDTDFDILYDC